MCDADYEVLFNKREGMVVDQKSATFLTTNWENDTYFLDMFSADDSLCHCLFSHAQS